MSIEQMIKQALKLGIKRSQIANEVGGHWKNNIYRKGIFENNTSDTIKRFESAINKIKKARKSGV